MSPSVERYQRRGAGIQPTMRVKKPTYVTVTAQKSEPHFSPDGRAGNEQRAMGHFYEQVHNLMVSYLRLDEAGERNTYYKNHKAEALAGGNELVNAINDLLTRASEYDRQYDTYYNFLIMSLLHENTGSLTAIGIEINRYERVYLLKHTFYNALTTQPDLFEFLFKPNDGLIDRLDQINLKLLKTNDPSKRSGQIIDLKG
ncbi:MAG: hypothetical protein PWP51_946 [Clostridiales bacterium]|jgi:hypothetical protein|nr:hypothetical protein [Clostridiales bacterium]MDN5298393.1 hypothetical protein [Clostridiales bacterium]